MDHSKFSNLALESNSRKNSISIYTWNIILRLDLLKISERLAQKSRN